MAGIYIHIPFCSKKCTYCDFHFSTSFASYENKMIEALLSEIKARSKEINESIKTIYFGGGTPSLLKISDLKQIVENIQKNYKIEKNVEITFEANPENINEANVEAWKKIGINRLSIGIQSFDEEDLHWMNRAHSANQSLQAVKIAQENGISNISIDLIYGLPNMDEKRWLKQIEKALSLDVKHISAYCLTIEEKTKLNQLVLQHKIIPANNEMQARHFEILQEELKKADFIQYEISNFGQENYFSKHNSAYWKGEKYIGIGPSAHSFDGKSRSWNISNNTVYIKGIESNSRNFAHEELSQKDKFNELLLIGLRTIWGVDLMQLSKIANLTKDFDLKVKKLISDGKALIKNNVLILTEKGFLFADSIAMDLFLD